MNTDLIPQKQRDVLIAFLVFLACIFYSFFVHEPPLDIPTILVGN
jgi:hypothetical protein